MNITNGLKDITKHTSSLGFLDMVKVIGTKTSADIEAIDANKSVVVYGKMNEQIEGIESTTGLARFSVLTSLFNAPNFQTPETKVDVVSETRNGIIVPTEIKFDNTKGSIGYYRFLGEQIVNEQIKVPPFKGAVWDVTIEPTTSAINDLTYQQSMLGSYESNFIAFVENSQLKFKVGAGGTDRLTIVFAEGVTGSLKHQWAWPLSQVLSILKLHKDSKKTTMFLSDMGALKITIDSGLGVYDYILPARSK
jgi:hypothetical protein